MLQEKIEEFLTSSEANGRASRTVETYRQRLASFQQFMASQAIYRLDRITPAAIDLWAVSLRRQGERYTGHPHRPIEDGGLANSTIAGRIQAVKTFLAFCVDRGHLDRSPAGHLKKPRAEGSTKDKVMTLADLRLLEAEAERRAKAGRPRDLALVRFVADTGVRRGEIVTLRISRLNLEKNEAQVRGKTRNWKEWRTVDFGHRTAEALRDWLDARPYADHDFVFVNLGRNPDRFGQPLTPQGVYQFFKRLAKVAGVKGRYNPHAVRHLVGQHFTDMTNLEVARQKLGHTDIATTAMFYAHQDRDRVKKASKRHSLLNHISSE